ncbi:extracellular solute-binding protein [Treponema sp. OMZ 840]|uniref:extracellular solute-binding protein n=1 Tax=Treponema sp. OMZ 840 TaxID=244313 RepID=UPI003D8D3C07
MKKVFVFFCVMLMSFSLMYAAGGKDTAGAAAKDGLTGKVVVYYSGGEDALDVLAREWKKIHPNCKLEFIRAGSGELTARIEAEKDLPQADVMIGGSYSIYAGVVDYLQPYVSPLRKECLPSYCGESDMYTPMQINVNTIIVNNKMVKDLGVKIDGWESLLNPAVKGKISYVDPSASSSAREQVINMLAAMAKKKGNRMDDNWDFIKAFYKNLDGKMYSSSTKVSQGVATGEYAVGITNEERVLELMKDGVDVSPVYAKEGITLRNSFMGVIKNCPYPEGAKAFVDFVLSRNVQQALATECLMRSVRPDVVYDGLKGVPSSAELPALNYPVDWVAANPKLKAVLQDIIANF